IGVEARMGKFQQEDDGQTRERSHPKARQAKRQTVGPVRSLWKIRRIDHAELLTLPALFQVGGHFRLQLFRQQGFVISSGLLIVTRYCRQLLFAYWRAIQAATIVVYLSFQSLDLRLLVCNLQFISL